MTKRKKCSLTTIGALAIAAILIIGTIVGVTMGKLSSGDDGNGNKQSIMDLSNNTASGSAASGTGAAQTEPAAKETEAADPGNKSANTPTQKPKTTKKPKSKKKPKGTTKPTASGGNGQDEELSDQTVTGKDNEISFSELQ